MAVIKVMVEIVDDSLGGTAKDSGSMTVPADQILRGGKVMAETGRLAGTLAMMVYDSIMVSLARKSLSVRP